MRLLVLLLVAVAVSSASKCPSGWLNRPSSSWCYQMINSESIKKNFSEANDFCRMQQAELLSVADADEKVWLANQISRYSESSDRNWWIGLKRQTPTAQWMWADGHGSETPDRVGKGTLLTWSKIADADAPGNCIAAQAQVSKAYFYVSPRDCSQSYKYICKKLKQEAIACDTENGWEAHGDRCYKLWGISSGGSGYNWGSANFLCQADEATLASIQSRSMNQFVRDLVARNGGGNYWLGLKSYSVSGGGHEWKWSDSSDISYESWQSGSRPAVPDGQEDNVCVRTVSTDVDGLWGGYGCNGRLGFVCSKAAGQCADGWLQHRDQCVLIGRGNKAWDQAEEICSGFGADVLQIKQRHKQEFINKYRAELTQENIDFVWIGLYKSSSPESGNLTWTTGGDISTAYTNWAANEPILIAGRANAVRMIAADDDGRWEVANPVAMGGVVCELPLGKPPLQPPTPEPEYTCDAFWFKHRRSCYLFSGESTDWLTAESKCKSQYAADLVDIRDSQEQEFVQAQLFYRDYWIGLHARTSELPNSPEDTRVWVWNVDNSRATYFNWNAGEPLSKEDNCVEMYQSGTWNNNKCTYRLPYVCKRPAAINGVTPTIPTAAPTTSFDPFCGPGWTRDPLSDFCYMFQLTQLSWPDAKHQCEFLGGDLLSIVKQTEKSYIVARMQSITQSNSGLRAFWIGFNDRFEQNRWVWGDYQPVVYTNWANGEPNNAHPDGEDCAIVLTKDSKWLDVNCGLRYPSICKKRGNSLITIQPPATTITVPDGYVRGCRDGYSNYRGMCYRVNGTALSWLAARDRCRMEGGDLASVGQQQENQFLVELAADAAVQGKIWIGFKDSISQQRTMYFRWSDDMNPTFTDWDIYEPNDYEGQEDCTLMMTHRFGRWNDENCGSKYPFVCKQREQAILVPQTTTPPPGCPPDYDNAYDGYCFKFVVGNVALSYLNVRDVCKNSSGGVLATIPNEDVQNHFVLKMSQMNSLTDYWIGLRRVGFVSYAWDDGRPVTYTNWRQGINPYGYRGYISAIDGGWNLSDRYIRLTNYVCQVRQIGYSTEPTTFNPAYCANGWVEVDDKCFRGFSTSSAAERLTWTEARVRCQSLSGDLASITSADVQTNLTKTIGGRDGYWIGLNSRDSSKDYVWANGEPLRYIQWRGDQQPENINGAQNCVQLSPTDMKWTLDNCNAAKNWICEAPKGIYPTGTMPPTTSEPDIPDCGDGWKYFNGSCYYFNTDVTDWHKSWRRCQDMGGDLTSIRNQAESDFILRLTGKLHLTQVSYWIGLNELGHKDGFRWTDGSALNYVNWNSGEPNDWGGAEHCVSFYADNGLWNDDQCGLAKRSVCKRNNDTTTKAPATPLPGNCPARHFAVGDKCYRLFDRPLKDYQQAKNFCMSYIPDRKSYLATISNEYEQALLSAMRVISETSLWIGLESRGFGHQYYWHDNSEVTFTNWDYNEPNGYRDFCVEMYTEPARMGKWNDNTCSKQRGYICMTYKDAALATEYPRPTGVSCPSGWNSYGNSCFGFFPQAATWRAAVAQCSTLGGNLANVEGVFEQSFLHFQTETIGKLSTWIGLSNTQSADKGQYQWVNNWPITYTNWGRNQPNQSESDSCVYMDSLGYWFDGNCNTNLPFTCRINQGTPPTLHPETPGSCPDQYEPFGSDCYFFADNNARLTGQEAQYECSRARANLVSILSPAEQSFVSRRIKQNVEDERFRADYWIGLLRTNEGGFEWQDRNLLGFTQWSRNEPSNTDRENCVEMYHSNLKWNDHYCNKRNSYVCKMPKMPSTGTTALTTRSPTTRLTQPPATTTTHPEGTRSSGVTASTAAQRTTTRISKARPEDMRNDGLVALFLIIMVVALIGLVLATVLYAKMSSPKPMPDNEAFSNVNWSRSTDAVSLDAEKPGNVALDGGVSNPNFSTS